MAEKGGLFVPKRRVTSKTADIVQQSMHLKKKVITTAIRPFLGFPKESHLNTPHNPSSGRHNDAISEAPLELHVSFCQEVSTLDINSEDKIWSVVEVTANVKPPSQTIGDKALNLVVVLDCSAYASQYCVLNAIQTVLHISRLLSCDKDKLAIVASSQRQSGGLTLTACVIRQLENLNLAEIEADLNNAIENRVLNSPKDLDLSENLVIAFRLLGVDKPCTDETDRRISSAQNTASKMTDGAASAIFLLSPNASEFCDALDTTPVPVHIINPGLVTCGKSKSKQGGWQLSLSTLATDECSSDSELKLLIEFARCQRHCGQVRNLTINVEAAPGCSVEELLGTQQHELLRPGETALLGVLVRLKTFNGLNFYDSLCSSRADYNDALINELEGFLGVASQELFTVRVSYCSSASNYTVTNARYYTSSIGRHDPKSDWLGRSMLDLRHHEDLSRSLTYQNLLNVVSQSFPVESALRLIHEIEMAGNLGPEAEASNLLLTKELQYLNNVASKRTSSASSSGITSRKADVLKENATGNQIIEVISVGEAYPVLTKHITPTSKGAGAYSQLAIQRDLATEWNLQTSESISEGSGSSTATTIHHKTHENRVEGYDKARNIWKLIRRDSKSKKQLIREKSQSQACSTWHAAESEELDRLDYLRQQALASKRSIGSDTLRSLSLGSDPKLFNQHAPWL